MADHGARNHATWSASATARNWHCAGALAMAERAPAQKESVHAARGTACHQIAEKCLRLNHDWSNSPGDFLGSIEKTKEFEIEIDEELVSSAQEYVDYVRGRYDCSETSAQSVSLEIEQRFTLNSLNPPFDAGGTADAVLHFYRDKLLEVVDLKNGMGVVDVKGNPQLRTYALGALLANPGLDVDHVKVTIVQPRAPHKDGRIRSETFHVADLMEWTADLVAAMRRSKQALDEYAVAKDNAVLFDEWVEKWLNPGKCKFCPAEGFCPKLKKHALDVAGVWFDDRDQAQIANKPGELSPEELAKTLDSLDLLEDWIKAVRGFAHTLAETGVEIPGYQLSEKIGNRRWSLPEASIATALTNEAGLDDDQIYTKKLITPAQADKLLGAKRKSLIEPWVERPVTGTNLVSASKTTRPPAKSKAEQYFEAN